MGILEVCGSDFAANLANVETEEADSQSEYDKVTQENAVTKMTLSQDEKYKTQEFKTLDKSIVDNSADRVTVRKELNAVDEFYAQLRDRCIAEPEGYAERKRRREAEIAG